MTRPARRSVALDATSADTKTRILDAAEQLGRDFSRLAGEALGEQERDGKGVLFRNARADEPALIRRSDGKIFRAVNKTARIFFP